ncbi:MAG: hypothetical protein JHC26_06405 [Thermofilum sp.]|uniref:hypothetical protein n=1 Tax=Thermofilum sp. TaxID=1961369 RepID=UPI00258B73F1|nr:hypothetical protein [Thermofilum sp.]MCI4408704.1 hypothetical protein [Thermofilum sp.]
MSDRKFSFMLEFSYKYADDDVGDFPDVDDIFGSYVRDSFVENRFYLLIQYDTAKSHLSKLSKWRKAFERLYDYDWDGSENFMWIYIPARGGLYEKLDIFFSNNKRQIENLTGTRHHEYGLISDHYGEAQIEFGGIDLRYEGDIDYAVYTLKMRLLLIDAILDYCEDKSVEYLEYATWDHHFKKFIRNRRALMSYLRK